MAQADIYIQMENALACSDAFGLWMDDDDVDDNRGGDDDIYIYIHTHFIY